MKPTDSTITKDQLDALSRLELSQPIKLGDQESLVKMNLAQASADGSNPQLTREGRKQLYWPMGNNFGFDLNKMTQTAIRTIQSHPEKLKAALLESRKQTATQDPKKNALFTVERFMREFSKNISLFSNIEQIIGLKRGIDKMNEMQPGLQEKSTQSIEKE